MRNGRSQTVTREWQSDLDGLRNVSVIWLCVVPGPSSWSDRPHMQSLSANGLNLLSLASFAFSPDCQWLAVAIPEAGVLVYQAGNYTQPALVIRPMNTRQGFIHELRTGEVCTLVFLNRSRWLALAWPCSAEIYDLPQGNLITRLPALSNRVMPLPVAATEPGVAVSRGRGLWLIRPSADRSGSTVGEWRCVNRDRLSVISPCGRFAFRTPPPRLIDPLSDTVLADVACPETYRPEADPTASDPRSSFRPAVFASDGTAFAVIWDDSSIWVYQLGKLNAVPPPGLDPTTRAPVVHELAVSRPTLEPCWISPELRSARLRPVAVGPYARRILLRWPGNRVQCWDNTSLKCTIWNWQTSLINHLAIAPDDTLGLAGLSEGPPGVWDLM